LRRLRITRLPLHVRSASALLWLLPLGLLPQLAMHGGGARPGFGPDTTVSLLPATHVLLYYAVFFAAGALYYEADDADGRLGRRWATHLGVALLVVLPVGLALGYGRLGIDALGPGLHHLLAALAQLTFAWLMTFGLIGLCRAALSRERPGVRYLSDAAYWMYLAHLPLIIGLQAVARALDLPGSLKFALVVGGCAALLLASYHLAVRPTWIGVLLNGRRKQPARRADAAAPTGT
jgi:peptidoglycan/LPS O-acetylase OafA/YrhL